MGLIAIPKSEDIPSELRPSMVVKPKLPEINSDDIPKPLGWRILVLPVMPPDETESGIALATDTVRHLELTRSVGVVLGIGDLAYSTARGYPEGYSPVKVGDWINFHSIAGQDTLIRDQRGAMVKIKYLNDNDILGIPPNPDALMVMV